MTGDESRRLSIGDRVRWGDTATDLGTVVGAAWSGVTIDWDDGHTNSVRHNDMANIERVPVKIKKSGIVRRIHDECYGCQGLIQRPLTNLKQVVSFINF